MGFLNSILSLLYPSECFLCGKNGRDLCLDCLVSSPRAERECERWIYPLFDYRHPPIKKAVWMLKYKNKRDLSKTFAEAIYPEILEELGDLSTLENFKRPILIPIPLSPERMSERKFNQAELIARHILEEDGENKSFILANDVLEKPKETKHQAHQKEKRQRLLNIVGTFRVKNKEKVFGKNIILIDDVTTTGATLSEAKKVLRESGAKKVIAFTLAH